MGRIPGWILAIMIVVAFTGLAAFLISLAPEPEDQELPTEIPFALTGEVRAGSETVPIFAAGTVRPLAEIHLAPQVGGKVVWVDSGFQSGAQVQDGQTLFRIEAADYEYDVQIAEADLAARQVALLEAEEQADIARSQYKLYAERQGGSELVRDANPLALWEPQLKAAEAALKRDEARVAEANLALSRTRVTAPVDGYVREESVDVGQILSSGERVARLFASHAVEVVVSLTDDEAALIPGLWGLRAGNDAQGVSARIISRYGEASYAWSGYVDRGEAAVDEQARTIDVVVRVPDPFSAGTLVAGTTAALGPPPLLVGDFVEVEIQGKAPQEFFRLARAALNPGNEVWTVDKNGIVSIREVKVLQRANDEVFVSGNLQSGQTVVTGGLRFATQGMRVQIEADSQS